MKRALLTLACTAALLGAANQAQADILLYTTPGAIQPDENLLFNGSVISGPALTVQGLTNQSGTVFDLTGTENLIASGGQARVEDEAQDGFNSLFIDAFDPKTFFTMFEANLNAIGDGSAMITATDSTGKQFAFDPFDLDGNGENFFSLEAVAGQKIDTIQILTIGTSLSDVRQIRIGGITTDGGGTPDPVPEPTLMALVGVGLLGAGIFRRRAN